MSTTRPFVLVTSHHQLEDASAHISQSPLWSSILIPESWCCTYGFTILVTLRSTIRSFSITVRRTIGNENNRGKLMSIDLRRSIIASIGVRRFTHLLWQGTIMLMVLSISSIFCIIQLDYEATIFFAWLPYCPKMTCGSRCCKHGWFRVPCKHRQANQTDCLVPLIIRMKSSNQFGWLACTLSQPWR